MTLTPLDRAYDDMSQAPDNGQARAAYYARLSATELFVLTTKEATETLSPQIVAMDGQDYALAFDTDARLAAFCDEPSPYVAMSGRALVSALAGGSLGLGINLGVSDSAMLLPPEVLDWIMTRASGDLRSGAGRINEVFPPDIEDLSVIEAMAERLAVFAAKGRGAYLVRAAYDQETVHLLVVTGCPDAERTALAGAIAESLRFLAPTLALDTVFVSQTDTLARSARKLGLAFDLAPAPQPAVRPAPGSDPAKPPKLK